MLKNFLRYHLNRVRIINEKYASPRIEMSGAVKFSLLILRLYLILLVGLLIFKFITLLQ
jgi:hypothetical protein